MNAIEVHGLQKRFGAVRALNGLDLTVRSGEVHAFLGPNGAGKTTTLRILAELRHLTRTAIDAELAAPVSMDGLPGVHDPDVVGLRLRCQVDNDALTDVLRRLAEAGVRTMTCQPPTLEDLFLRHYSAERDVAGAFR